MTQPLQKMDAEPERQSNMVSMLHRVLTDASIPMERFERILELHNVERARESKALFDAAMSKAQSQMRAVLVNKDNAQTRSKYASYSALDAVVRPIYTEHGFAVTFDTVDGAPPDCVRIIADVTNAGHERRYRVDMPCDGKGAKGGDVMTKTHAMKSAVSYGKATLLPMIFNLAVTDKADDDGNGASRRQAESKPTITPGQEKQIRDALAFRDVPEDKALRRFKVETLSEIYAVDFDACLKIAQNAGAAK